ncbi:unnamed protein product, partial [marine sediment metagenome]
MRVIDLVEGVGLVTLVVRTRCLCLEGVVKLFIVLVRLAIYSRVKVGNAGLVLENPNTITIKIVAI